MFFTQLLFGVWAVASQSIAERSLFGATPCAGRRRPPGGVLWRARAVGRPSRRRPYPRWLLPLQLSNNPRSLLLPPQTALFYACAGLSYLWFLRVPATASLVRAC